MHAWSWVFLVKEVGWKIGFFAGVAGAVGTALGRDFFT
jgi:hypothetical protein